MFPSLFYVIFYLKQKYFEVNHTLNGLNYQKADVIEVWYHYTNRLTRSESHGLSRESQY